MNILTKTVECGEYVFEIATDRNIAVKTFEAFPTFIEKAVNGDILSGQNEKDFFVTAVKQKRLGELLEAQEQISEIAAYALPMMIEKAGGERSVAAKILEYAKENDVDIMLANAIIEFLMQGFIRGERERAPKVRFAIR